MLVWHWHLKNKNIQITTEKPDPEKVQAFLLAAQVHSIFWCIFRLKNLI